MIKNYNENLSEEEDNMTRLMRKLKSKRHELTLLAVRFDGTEYVASIIRNMADLESPEVAEELKEAQSDLSVERFELYAMRRIRGGARRAVGKPIVIGA